ncbi:MAG: PHP domain-containing protein [Bryobacter sp.]|nr:PHP domain-containing protein [Bryobacter sp.]
MVDLHCHTNESDGTDSPAELIVKAIAEGVTVLSITDHDTFAAYEALEGCELPLELIQGVEISTRAKGKSIHLLAYWPGAEAPPPFLLWLRDMQEIRRERNRRLAERLRSLGLPVTLEEAEALGRTVTGRVHFAQLLQQKGIVATIPEAFDRFIGENAPGYVEMEDPTTSAAVRVVREHGGVPVLAHPIRLGMRDAEKEEAFIREQVEAGLLGLEVIHSDHDAAARARYAALAAKYSLITTGGSDYHGLVKPRVALGSGVEGNVAVPREWFEKLKQLGARNGSR